MRKKRRIETVEERHDRLLTEDRQRKDIARLKDDAIDRMIRLNIAQFGA